MEDFEAQVKVLVLGHGGVGKTSLIRRFCSNQFTDTYTKTIGVDFLEKALQVDALGCTVRLQLWDTAGQEEFDALTRSYYRGAKAAVLVFSTSDVASMEALPQWKTKVEEECGAIAMALVQNKCDLLGGDGVSADAAEAMARRLRLRVYRTCVREGLNCDAVFAYVVEQADIRARAGRAAECTVLDTSPAGQAMHRSAGPAVTLTLAENRQHAGSSAQLAPFGTGAQSGRGGAAAAPAAQRVDLRAPAKPARRRFLDCTIS